MKKLLNIIILLLAGYFFSEAQTVKPIKEPVTRILFILDGSGSMEQRWGETTKIAVAKRMISQMVDSLSKYPHIEIAMRIYGHLSLVDAKDCKDSRLEVSFGPQSALLIKSKLATLHPRGISPIAYSLEKAAIDIPADPNARNIIILITDGLESCEGNPCAVSMELQKKNIFLKPIVIGFGIPDNLRSSYSCMGALYDIKTANLYQQVLKSIITRVIHQTTVEVNLMDIHNKPTETNTDITFYDNFSEGMKYNFYHTFNYRGKSDTLYVDPILDYDVTIHTIPPLSKEDIVIEPKKHTVIDVPAAQGYLKVSLQSNTINKNLNSKIKCIVKKKDQFATLHVQELNEEEKYLTGLYDVEILTIPRIHMTEVSIDQSQITAIQIPTPGLLTVSKTYAGYGSLFYQHNNELIKVYEFDERNMREVVGIQPGNYRIIYRQKNAKSMEQTMEKTFKIESGGNVALKF